MATLLLLTNAMTPSSEVLPALALLGHSVRVAPAEVSALLNAPPSDAVLVDEAVITLLAAHAAIAITNARLTERSRELSVLAERQRVHAVVGGGGMQANERIRLQPMTSRGVPTVDHGHLNVCLGHQRVGEGKTARARPYNQIIGIDEQVLAPHLRATAATLARLR